MKECTIEAEGHLHDDYQRIREHFADEGKTPWCWVFYGDSITHGATHTHGWRSFPEIFAERIRWEIQHWQDVVINTGISGNTTAELIRDYDWRCRHWQPQVIFLLIGINDIVKPGDLGQYRANLLKLISLIRADGAIPIVQTYSRIQKIQENPGYWKRYVELPAYNGMIREIAQKEKLILVDHDLHWQKHAADPETLASWLGEPIHPGALGHLEMAMEIFRCLGIYDPAANSSNPDGSPFRIPAVSGQ